MNKSNRNKKQIRKIKNMNNKTDIIIIRNDIKTIKYDWNDVLFKSFNIRKMSLLNIPNMGVWIFPPLLDK